MGLDENFPVHRGLLLLARSAGRSKFRIGREAVLRAVSIHRKRLKFMDRLPFTLPIPCEPRKAHRRHPPPHSSALTDTLIRGHDGEFMAVK
jgi:hypothetical protein